MNTDDTHNYEYDHDEQLPDDLREDLSDRVLDTVLEWIETVVLAVFAMILIMSFVVKIVNVKGISMESTLYEGDRLLLTSFMYTPEQGDIVVVNSEYMDETIIKRVIATEGQTVEIDYSQGTVSVDGKLLDEPYINELMKDTGGYTTSEYDCDTGIYVYNVPKGCVFVMGDNRNHSTDSRTIGYVSKSEIVGKVIFRLSSSRGSFGRIK